VRHVGRNGENLAGIHVQVHAGQRVYRGRALAVSLVELSNLDHLDWPLVCTPPSRSGLGSPPENHRRVDGGPVHAQGAGRQFGDFALPVLFVELIALAEDRDHDVAIRVAILSGKAVEQRRGQLDGGRVEWNDAALGESRLFRFGGGRADPILELTTTVASRADRPLEFELAIEWNVNLLGGGHNPAAYYEAADGERTPHDAAGSRPNASDVTFGNDFEGVRIEASMEPAADLTWYPVETVSNSEGGFERSYQGSSLLFRWPVSLAPGEERTFTVTFAAHQTRDRAVEEAR